MMSYTMFLFFQAEDGIRDLVRSRGLGDVYKRQGRHRVLRPLRLQQGPRRRLRRHLLPDSLSEGPLPVSYTHLTLPTSDLV